MTVVFGGNLSMQTFVTLIKKYTLKSVIAEHGVIYTYNPKHLVG